MKDAGQLHLFQGYSVELEYMIVDRQSLSVLPVADRVLQAQAGALVNEVEVGPLCWSNEIVLHLIELKTNGPVATLDGLAESFQQGVAAINRQLAAQDGRLMPGAMHPWMDPHRETRLWPHGNSSIYAAYDRIFGCQGHGWSNLQSAHLNLPFQGDEEFGRLHAAIRLILPLLPALAASSPLLDGRHNGLFDNRLLVDLNRSRKNSSLFSMLARDLSRGEKEQILQRCYLPYRRVVTDRIDELIAAGAQVVHLSVHSFTPILHGRVRNTDLGLLYDPAQSNEKQFCQDWQRLLEQQAANLRVRCNYPYRGSDDGLVRSLCCRLDPQDYLGIELEVNQALLAGKKSFLAELQCQLLESLQELFPAN